MTAYPEGAIQDASRDPTAVPGRRIVAAVADGLIVTVPTFLLASREIEFLDEQDVGVPLGDFCDIHQDANEAAVCVQAFDRVYFTDGEVSAGPPLLGLGLALLLLVVLQGLTGLTPGKALLRIRTVGEDGRPPGVGRAAGRWLLLAVDTAPWFVPLVGLITMLTTVGHRRVGDMAAKTFVVSKADTGRPIVVPGYTPAHAMPAVPLGGPGSRPPGLPEAPGGHRPTGVGAPGGWSSGTAGAPGATGVPGARQEAPPARGAGGTPDPERSGTGRHAPPATGAGGTLEPAAADASGTRPSWPEPAADATPTAETPADETAKGETATAAHETAKGETATAGANGGGSEAGTPKDKAAAAGTGAGREAETRRDETPAGTDAEPSESTEEVPAATAGAAGADPTYDPQWDAARGTYIVWEPRRGKWLAWDTTAEEWKSL